MDINIVGICVTVLVGVFTLALAIFLGLRSFNSNIGDKLSSLKNDIVMQLSTMNEKMTKVETTAGNLWSLATAYLKSAPTTGTVTVPLKNFGDTKISATPGPNETTYVIEVAQGMLDAELIAKASKEDIAIRHFPPSLLAGMGKLLAINEVKAHIEIMEELGDICWVGEEKNVVQRTGSNNFLITMGAYLR
jgi:hypothetical protein